MRTKIVKIESFHPSGRTSIPSGICYMKGMFCKEARQNREKFLVPLSMDTLSGIVIFPEGLAIPEVPLKSYGISTGLFYGSFSNCDFTYGKESACITLWGLGRWQVRKTAKELCKRAECPLLLRCGRSHDIYIITNNRILEMNRKRFEGKSKETFEEKQDRERKEKLSGLALAAWNRKEDIISTPELYVSELPGLRCGTSFSGPIYLPVGALMECWQNCPEFRLPDGRCVIGFASGLSGFTKGEAISLNTGKISSFEASAFSPNSRAALVNGSAPYRRKATQYIKTGVLPFTRDELSERLSAEGGMKEK